MGWHLRVCPSQEWRWQGNPGLLDQKPWVADTMVLQEVLELQFANVWSKNATPCDNARPRAPLAAEFRSWRRGKDAFQLAWDRSIAGDDAAAQFRLGLRYEEGAGVAEDRAAVDWYRRAASGGNQRTALSRIREETRRPDPWSRSDRPRCRHRHALPERGAEAVKELRRGRQVHVTGALPNGWLLIAEEGEVGCGGRGACRPRLGNAPPPTSVL